MAKTCAIGMISAFAASTSLSQSKPALAEGGFNFTPFSSSTSQQTPASTQSNPTDSPASTAGDESSSKPPKVRNDNPRTTSAGFDPEALERGAKALREITSSSHAKKVFQTMKEQEETRQAEFAMKAQEFKAMQAQAEIERQRVVYDEQKKLAQHQAQMKSQTVRYEDELARKRMQAENELQKTRNQELVKLQEDSSIRQEQARSATEEQIQAQRRQTEREKAEIERETIRVRAMAEAEGRAHEAKLAEDVNRRVLVDRAKAEREKWVAAINTTFDHIGGGLRAILTDQDKLVVAVGGVTALAAGIYTTREGARVIWSYVDRILGQPSLIRESSRGKYPWSGLLSRLMTSLSSSGHKASASKNGNGFGDVVLHPSLHKRITQLASATANTKAHQAPFRNMLFYGPPGTGKTMAARELARKSVGMLLLLDLRLLPRYTSCLIGLKSLREAYYCSSTKLMHFYASDLDSAVADRIDEVLEFALPEEGERLKLIKLYLDKYIAQAGTQKSYSIKNLFKKESQKIEMKGLSEDILREAAGKTEGFSGREIAKLMASVQAAVYGSADCVLDSSLFREVVDYKVAEHQQRSKLGGSNSGIA